MTALLGKAEVLQRLQAQLRSATILPLCRINAVKWSERDPSAISDARSFLQAHAPLIARSSSAVEDLAGSSHAGMFLSVKGIGAWPELVTAIDDVIGSYKSLTTSDEVLLQPLAQAVTASGVAMTRDPETGAPYYIIEYSTAGDTDAVTLGAGQLRSLTVAALDSPVPGVLKPLLPAIAELDNLFDNSGVDVEFAITPDQILVFQCRPIVWRQRPKHLIGRSELLSFTSNIVGRLKASLVSGPASCLGRTVLGTMPDWNPAEMIGLKPRPLALSLYQYLITDSVWAGARAAYGYADLGSFPLMLSIGGTPYIDVRASCLSFTPVGISPLLAQEMVDGAVERLAHKPDLFDKLEFSIIPTCYTPSLELAQRSDWGIASDSDWRTYLGALRHLTSEIIRPGGLFERDLVHVNALANTRMTTAESGSNQASAAMEVIDKVRSEGTPVFARVARTAFIATAIIKSLEAECSDGSLCERLMGPVQTVASTIARDFRTLSRDQFLARHGHVRPGTYDIRVPRYDEEPDKYFDWASIPRHDPGAPASLLPCVSEAADRCLRASRLNTDFQSFVGFARQAIAAREDAKYHFTRLLSEALALLCDYATASGLSRDQLSFLTLEDLRNAASLGQPAKLPELAALRQSSWIQDAMVRLPPLITTPEDALAFDQCATPNFITREIAEGPVATVATTGLRGSIVLLESADPGFDWIFARDIAGFITAYGGENSHMAIRAREFGLPAVIGAGETYYRRWRNAAHLRLDCGSRRVEVLS